MGPYAARFDVHFRSLMKTERACQSSCSSDDGFSFPVSLVMTSTVRGLAAGEFRC